MRGALFLLLGRSSTDLLFIARTTTNMKIRTTLGSLSRTLASAPKEICEEFIELRGVEALRKVLARLVRPPIQERGELASQSIVEILGILQSVMRYGGVRSDPSSPSLVVSADFILDCAS